MFHVGLHMFEDEPYVKPGLADMKNAVVCKVSGFLMQWTLGMATLAPLNVLGKVKRHSLDAFLNDNSLHLLRARAIKIFTRKKKEFAIDPP
ncbi:hypothetical protein K7X08_030956 [Anisodus acutangulus]|uniref:Uncharacterized protein n=1 Tax=Anisodus acutangulus TaxID=402998 RepID=A0A9Q1MYQ5_9SOLA|nr:hypothetical protein K7X08_030956 [Anisodus acutangulus]